MRPRRILAASIFLVSGVMLLGLAPSAAATAPAAGSRGGIDVVKVDGFLDPTNLDFVLGAIRQANARGSELVVLQIDSVGVLDADVDRLLAAIGRSDVPVGAWVGPSGASAGGGPALVVAAAHVNGISQGSSIGPAYPVSLDGSHEESRAAVAAQARALERSRGRSGDGAVRLTRQSSSASVARRSGIVERIAPTLGDFIVALDGEKVTTANGTHVLSTAKVVGKGENRRRQPNQELRFLRPDLGDQVLHTLNEPGIAYFLFVAGLSLILFEFFTAGIGLAGLVGAGALVGAFVGFSHLPVRIWAAACLVACMVAFAVDIQAQITKAWSVIGAVLLALGSWFLFSTDALRPSWWVFVLVIGGTVAFMLAAMPSMVRSRFSTPTVGREGLIGEEGVAETPVAPEGVVKVRDALWRARTDRDTPIEAGEGMRVRTIEGLILEVEPLTEPDRSD